MNAMLAFEDAPPYSVPLRFFLTAPLYGMAAALWWGVSIDEVMLSRWSPAALVLTHLFTIGVLLQVMLGALFQFLPVAAGVRIPYSPRVAGVVHGFLNGGLLLLCAGFLGWGAWALWLGGVALMLALLVFFAVVGRALLPVSHTSPTISSLKLALLGLLVTVSLGGSLVLTMLGHWALPLIDLTRLHVSWGVLGWSMALVAGVSYVVVPMFQLTPAYRPAWGWRFVPFVMIVLVLWSFSAGPGVVNAVLGSLLAFMACAYAALTLQLQSRRKRPVTDATVLYWRAGMLLVFPAAVWWCGAMWGLPWLDGREVVLGVLVFPGALWCVVSGMLYKIVPFLAWMHLQATLLPLGKRVPHMGTFIDERWAKRQFYLHLLALGSLVLAAYWPVFRELAALPLGASFALLGWNLWRAAWRYRQQIKLLEPETTSA